MKPRVASYYDQRVSGRNDGNPLFVSHVLRRDYAEQIDYHHLVPDPALQFESMGRFDFHLWIDWGEDALRGILPYTPIVCPQPNAYWASDTHLGYDYRLQKAREFDSVFCAQKAAVEQFSRDGVAGYLEWLPHAVEPQAYNPAAIYAQTPEEMAGMAHIRRLPEWDVCFVGHINNAERLDLLDTVFEAFPNSWFGSRRTGRLFERAADVYTRSKICLNHSIRDDVNMRVFEVLATRSFLLTTNVPTLHDLFRDGTHLVTFDSPEDAIEKARYYVSHDDEREQIAEAGYQETLARHTMKHRVERILAVSEILSPV